MQAESFDIVVTGVASPIVSAKTLAQRLAPLAGVTPGSISLGLVRGEVTLRQGVDGSRAEQLASDARQLGAKVELRPSQGSLVIEPDIEDPQVHRGSPLAPPPVFAGESEPIELEPELLELELEPEPAASLQPALEPSQDAPGDFLLSLEAATSADTPVVMLDGSPAGGDEEEEVDTAPLVQEPAARSAGVTREQPSDRVLDLDDDPGAERPRDEAHGAAPSAQVDTSPSSGDLPRPQPMLAKPASTLPTPPPARVSPTSPPPARTKAQAPPDTKAFVGDGVFDQPRRGLLTHDSVANYLFAVAAALVVGAMAGFAIQRALYRDEISAVEARIQQGHEDPAAIDTGELPSAEELEEDLDNLYRSASRSVYLSLAAAALVGLGIGTIKR